MKKWEYKYLSRQTDEIETLNQLGEDGWELVLKTNEDFLFKREKF